VRGAIKKSVNSPSIFSSKPEVTNYQTDHGIEKFQLGYLSGRKSKYSYKVILYKPKY
jgi:hypothetical protein